MRIISAVMVALKSSFSSPFPLRHKWGNCHQTFMWPTKRLIWLPNQSLTQDVKSLRCCVPNKSHFFPAVHVYNVLLSRELLVGGGFSCATCNCLLTISNKTLHHFPSKPTELKKDGKGYYYGLSLKLALVSDCSDSWFEVCVVDKHNKS